MKMTIIAALTLAMVMALISNCQAIPSGSKRALSQPSRAVFISPRAFVHSRARPADSDDMMFDEDDLLEFAKRPNEDYGHMRFGKRDDQFDDYGHMRFGRGNVD